MYENEYSNYINRELSWLKFNKRVLEEALDETNPLIERLRFLQITVANLDEFFMIRVGALYVQNKLSPEAIDNKSGMTMKEQLDAIYTQCNDFYPKISKAYRKIMKSFAEYNVNNVAINKVPKVIRQYLKEYFEKEVLPLLSPQIIGSRHPFPHLENGRLYAMVRLENKGEKYYGVIAIPDTLQKIIPLPANKTNFILIEQLVYKYVHLAFPSAQTIGKALIRVTRNADIEVDDKTADEDEDFKTVMISALKTRRRLDAVRLEALKGSDATILNYILEKLGLPKHALFTATEHFDYRIIEYIENVVDKDTRKLLLYPPIKQHWPPGLEAGNLINTTLKKDLFLFYPYHSMQVFIELLREACLNPDVLSIKITLYRIGTDSQVAQYLCQAAESGKDVTVIIELRARFDEQNNINWSSRLQDSGCRVLYGLEGYKVHTKLMALTLRTPTGLKYITHFGTGNYNEKTARLYVDLNIITADPDLNKDAAEFFNQITTGNIYGSYNKLLVAPTTLKDGLISLIDQEADKAKNGKPARIIAKMNSLTDIDLTEALIRASKAGVQIDLIVRGICCLRPGIEGETENIHIRNIVGRFLEHSRIYVFGEGSERKVYISSADMMTRNVTRRVELAIPVLDKEIADKIMGIFDILFRDNVKARLLQTSGSYKKVKIKGEDTPLISAQEYFLEHPELIDISYGPQAKGSQIAEKTSIFIKQLFASVKHTASNIKASIKPKSSAK